MPLPRLPGLSPRAKAVLPTGGFLFLLLLGTGLGYQSRARVVEADLALQQLGRMQAAHRRLYGEYTGNLSRLADLSGDWFAFVDGLDKVLDLRAEFAMQGDARGYRIEARARDWRRTRVLLVGPPPKR